MAARSGSSIRCEDVYRPELEAALVDTLAERIADGFAGRRNWRRVHRELVVGTSVADLVLFSGGQRAFTFPSPLSVTESVVLSLVRRRDGSVSVDELENFPGSANVHRTIRRLASQGILRQTKTGVRAVKRWWTSGALFAIEAKLMRWRDALGQAIDYRGFADAAFVALPDGYACAALAGEKEFEKAGVGLVLVTSTGLKRVFDARPAMGHGWRREFAYSRLASASP